MTFAVALSKIPHTVARRPTDSQGREASSPAVSSDMLVSAGESERKKKECSDRNGWNSSPRSPQREVGYLGEFTPQRTTHPNGEMPAPICQALGPSCYRGLGSELVALIVWEEPRLVTNPTSARRWKSDPYPQAQPTRQRTEAGLPNARYRLGIRLLIQENRNTSLKRWQCLRKDFRGSTRGCGLP